MTLFQIYIIAPSNKPTDIATHVFAINLSLNLGEIKFSSRGRRDNAILYLLKKKYTSWN